MIYRLDYYKVELKVQGYETCILRKNIYVIVINNKILVSWESAKILNDAVYSLSWQVFNVLFIVYTTLKKMLTSNF